MVDPSGNSSWQPFGGYEVVSFTLSGIGVAPIVEVGSSRSTINWSADFNFTPTSITVTCTGHAPQTPVPSGTTSSGTFVGPFTSSINGDTINLSITAIDPNGSPQVFNTNITYAAKIVWGSVTSPIAGQSLWGQLNATNNILNPTRHATLAFASASGQQQTFAILASLGSPILTDSGGDVYPATLIGSQTISENGTNQLMDFYFVGVPGITFTWSMT